MTRDAYFAYYHGKDAECKPDNREGDCEFDEIARAVLERLVYTNCEMCCDCIGCGQLSLPENPDAELLPLHEERRNCPLHVYWDNCRHFPD